jgi:hypothetical protein
LSFSSVCEKCSALRFSWAAICESWRERDSWVGFDVVEVGGLRGRRVLVSVGARAVVFNDDVGTGEGGRSDERGGEGESRGMEESRGASCFGENSRVGMEGRSGAGRLVGGCVRCSFRGQQRRRRRKGEGREAKPDARP